MALIFRLNLDNRLTSIFVAVATVAATTVAHATILAQPTGKVKHIFQKMRQNKEKLSLEVSP